jgi:hypothetical protein
MLNVTGAREEGAAEVAGGDPAAVGAAEHPDSTATKHRDAAKIIDSLAGIR